MGPGFCLHEQPGQGSWTRTAEHLGVLPPGPAVGRREAEPELGAVGAAAVGWEGGVGAGTG